jgi:hypothetical protein
MDIIVKITDSSPSTGPTFNLYSNVDNYTTAFVTNVSKASLLSGYYTNLAPTNTTSVRVKSMGVDCTNFVTVNITPTTTTTTTAYPVTVDFTLEISTSYVYANPAILSRNWSGSPSGLYAMTATWYTSEEEASDPYGYSSLPYTNHTYWYAGGNQPPTNYGFPPGTYWFGVRDFNNYLNMKVKSFTVLPSTTSTTTTAPILTPILVYINFTSGSVLCTNPTSEASLTVYCTTSTLQANSKIYYSNGTNNPAASGLYVSAGLVGGVPGPVFRVIDNAGTLAAHTC